MCRVPCTPPSTPPAPPSDTCNVPTETHDDKAGQKADLPTADDVIVGGGGKSSTLILGRQIGYGGSEIGALHDRGVVAGA